MAKVYVQRREDLLTAVANIIVLAKVLVLGSCFAALNQDEDKPHARIVKAGKLLGLSLLGAAEDFKVCEAQTIPQSDKTVVLAKDRISQVSRLFADFCECLIIHFEFFKSVKGEDVTPPEDLPDTEMQDRFQKCCSLHSSVKARLQKGGEMIWAATELVDQTGKQTAMSWWPVPASSCPNVVFTEKDLQVFKCAEKLQQANRCCSFAIICSTSYFRCIPTNKLMLLAK